VIKQLTHIDSKGLWPNDIQGIILRKLKLEIRVRKNSGAVLGELLDSGGCIIIRVKTGILRTKGATF